MLFHNRPVRADMGSVIVMVECRLSGSKVWLVPNLQLYILGVQWRWAGSSAFAAEWSESESCHCSSFLLSLASQLTGPYQPCWGFSELLRFSSFESLISGSKMKWRWGLVRCGPGLWRWESKLATQDCLVTREYLLWIWTWLILQYYYPLILLCLIHSNLTAEKWLQH